MAALLLAAPLIAAETTNGGSEDDVQAARSILATQRVRSESDEDIRYFSDVQAAFDLFGSAAAIANQESIEGGDTRAALFVGLRKAATTVTS